MTIVADSLSFLVSVSSVISNDFWFQSLLAQIECQSQEITEKIGQIKAMTEEMEKNAALFQECEAQLKVNLVAANIRQTNN